MLADAGMREAMAQAGTRAAQGYSWEEISGRVLGFYEDTIAGRNGHGGA
jgi:hypothetical protein